MTGKVKIEIISCEREDPHLEWWDVRSRAITYRSQLYNFDILSSYINGFSLI